MNNTNFIDRIQLFHRWNNTCFTDRITFIPETEYNLFHRWNNIYSTDEITFNIYNVVTCNMLYHVTRSNM